MMFFKDSLKEDPYSCSLHVSFLTLKNSEFLDVSLLLWYKGNNRSISPRPRNAQTQKMYIKFSSNYFVGLQ